MARYIDADATLDTMRDEMAGTGYQSIAMDVIKYAPTADVVEVKHGEWSVAIGYDINKIVKCSVCKLMTYEPTNFCPHCGADMRGVKAEDIKTLSGKVYKSRYTPNLKNGKDVHFEIGETVKYRMRNGTEYEIVIDSELKQNSGYLGYEAIFPDGRYFAVAEGIIDWEGAVHNDR